MSAGLNGRGILGVGGAEDGGGVVVRTETEKGCRFEVWCLIQPGCQLDLWCEAQKPAKSGQATEMERPEKAEEPIQAGDAI